MKKSVNVISKKEIASLSCMLNWFMTHLQKLCSTGLYNAVGHSVLVPAVVGWTKILGIGDASSTLAVAPKKLKLILLS